MESTITPSTFKSTPNRHSHTNIVWHERDCYTNLCTRVRVPVCGKHLFHAATTDQSWIPLWIIAAQLSCVTRFDWPVSLANRFFFTHALTSLERAYLTTATLTSCQRTELLNHHRPSPSRADTLLGREGFFRMYRIHLTHITLYSYHIAGDLSRIDAQIAAAKLTHA